MRPVTFGDGVVRSTQLADQLLALRTAGTVLHLGAHPDDEESGVLALMARGHGARVVYWSATRGEGGQNKRGPERGDALGVLRTWESLAARAVDGADVRYGPFIDYGFSKSGDDTLRRWGRDELVREIVRAIRLVQPLVVIGRWTGTPADGHGHHQAVGMVTAEAFDAAAEPSRFIELGLPPWRAAKLYRSLAGDWQPGEDVRHVVEPSEHEAAGHLGVDTGALDPLSRLSFQELADAAINRHRSQGMGLVPEPGPCVIWYRLERAPGERSTARETSFYDGLDPGIAAMAENPGGGPADLRERLQATAGFADSALDAYRPHEPWSAGPALLGGAAALRDVLAALAPEDAALALGLERLAAAFDEAAAMCFGLRLECLAERARVTPGSDLAVRAQVHNGGPQCVEVERLDLELPAGWRAARGENGAFIVAVPSDAPPRAPYWLRQPHGPYRCVWPPDARELGHAVDEPLIVAVAKVRMDGCLLELRSPALERSGFSGGSRALPVTVVPPVALVPREPRAILPVSEHATLLQCDVLVQCIEPDGASGALRLTAPEGWPVAPAAADFAFARGGESETLSFRVTVPAGARPAAYELRYDGVELNPVRLGAPETAGRVDERSCIAEANLVRPATVVVDLVDVQFVRTLRYGYVRGIEEEIPAALARFGLDLTELRDEDLTHSDLQGFDAIVVGPNAYNLRGEVRRQAQRLLDYVAEGGTLVVQSQGYGYDEPGLAPYPFRMHQPHDRVTEPTAPVELVDPESVILHTPNTIRPADFDGWVQDRGLYFLAEWDRRYRPVLACHDAGEPPQQGGLLTATHGRGTYVYVGYSLFRQIPAGVPGAIRLSANLLGLAEARVRERMEHLRGLELIGHMDERELYEAARIVSERWVAAGTWLGRQEEVGRELFLLLDGEIEVVKHLPAGDRVLYVARSGESLGELSLLAGIPRSASMRTVTDVTVLVLRADAFETWLQSRPDLARRLLELLARKVVARDPDG